VLCELRTKQSNEFVRSLGWICFHSCEKAVDCRWNWAWTWLWFIPHPWCHTHHCLSSAAEVTSSLMSFISLRLSELYFSNLHICHGVHDPLQSLSRCHLWAGFNILLSVICYASGASCFSVTVPLSFRLHRWSSFLSKMLHYHLWCDTSSFICQDVSGHKS